ncbi:hypothetical protein C725_0890 [Pacificimonas flava]|uniref:Uncharacterized protein n=1 Tax=Pacificimonas flava TaxID=1234595 RepID=M2U7E5_9SPHN|nr:hypothetical protein C725_0890 [Pacificimonas flava]
MTEFKHETIPPSHVIRAASGRLMRLSVLKVEPAFNFV